MKRSVEEHLLDPEPGSAAAAAREFGIDLTLLIKRLRLTPEQRLDELQQMMDALEEAQVAGKRRTMSRDQVTEDPATVRS